jgi:hypothetical protein
MFDALDQIIKHDDAVEISLKERIVKGVVIARGIPGRRAEDAPSNAATSWSAGSLATKPAPEQRFFAEENTTY